MRRRLIPLVVLVSAALLAAGCGGSDDDGDASPTPAATAATPTGSPEAEGSTRVAQDGDTVRVHYHGTLPGGEVFDSSREREPLEFTLGTGQVIDGFNDAVLGLAIGESVTVTLEPEQAYGQRRDDLVVDIDASGAPDGLAVGDLVRLANGAAATVLSISDEVVRVDANHALAGETLTFEIELIAIR